MLVSAYQVQARYKSLFAKNLRKREILISFILNINYCVINIQIQCICRIFSKYPRLTESKDKSSYQKGIVLTIS